jgi:hypothetical protein
MMRREVAESPVVVDGNTLVPIVEVSLQHWCDKRGTTFFGWKIPTAVVVISRTEEKALRMTGEEVPLAELSAKVEGMEEVLRQARRTPEAGPGRKEGSASRET